jgi:uncharacterized RDD family membrane protein YckC
MHCKHCGFVNGEDDHRCLRCGRRIAGVVIAAPAGYSGANALAPALIPAMMMSDEGTEFSPAGSAKAAQPAPAQTPLFPTQITNLGPNVIPFDRREREATGKFGHMPAAAPSPRVTSQRKSGFTDTQTLLDFIPASPQKNRKLKTDVDAQVFCDLPVATPTHRLVAAAIDAAFILFGFGLLVGLFDVLGGSFGAGKTLWIGMASALALVSMLYGLIWAIAGRETAGMRFTDLRLITFDGFQLDPRSRALRFASTWLSFCSVGLGLLWAVADEENLTWHDHISKTFPTIREVSGTFVRQRD